MNMPVDPVRKNDTIDFALRVLGLVETASTLTPALLALATAARKALDPAEPDPTSEQWAALDAEEEAAFQALKDASKP